MKRITRKPWVPWDDEDVARLPGLAREHQKSKGTLVYVDWASVAEALGGTHTASACKERYKTMTTVDGGKPPRPSVQGASLASSRPVAESWNHAKTTTSRDLQRHAAMRFADVDFGAEDKPVGVAVISDQHIRQSGPIDLVRMEQDARLIESTHGLYAVLGGDGVDNHIKHHAAMVHGGTNPSEEWRLYDHYLGFFGDKILAMISGNHDDWTEDVAGVSVVAILAERRRLFFAKDEILLRMQLGSIQRVMKVRHQYRFNSSMNQTHTVKQLLRFGEDDFDIGVVCHHHETALEPFRFQGRTVWAARPGSYQLTSGYSRRYGHNHAKPTCPTFILFPDGSEVMGFVDVHQAAGFLTYLRAGWPRNWRRAG